MVLAFSTGSLAADTGKPGLTSPQARVSSSGDSEVARVSSAVSQNVEARRTETPRAVEPPAETQKPRKLPPKLQAELDKTRDISFSDRKQVELSAKELTQQLDQKRAQEVQALERAEKPSPAENKAKVVDEQNSREQIREERRVNKERAATESKPQEAPTIRLEAQRAYLDRIDAQRAYRKAAEREVQVSSEQRARSAA